MRLVLLLLPLLAACCCLGQDNKGLWSVYGEVAYMYNYSRTTPMLLGNPASRQEPKASSGLGGGLGLEYRYRHQVFSAGLRSVRTGYHFYAVNDSDTLGQSYVVFGQPYKNNLCLFVNYGYSLSWRRFSLEPSVGLGVLLRPDYFHNSSAYFKIETEEVLLQMRGQYTGNLPVLLSGGLGVGYSFSVRNRPCRLLYQANYSRATAVLYTYTAELAVNGQTNTYRGDNRAVVFGQALRLVVGLLSKHPAGRNAGAQAPPGKPIN